MAAATNFKLGDRFSSFDDFEAKFERHKREKFIEMWTRDCRTIAAEELTGQ